MIGGEENDKMFDRISEKYYAGCIEEIYHQIQSRAYKIKELETQRNRLLTLAVKWCDKSHHDWEEIKSICDECSFMDLRDSGGLSEEP